MRPLVPSFERSLASRTPTRAATKLQRELAVLQEQAATGLRVVRPSDDPTSFERARYFEAQSGRIDTHLRTIGASRLWVDETAAALSDLTEFAVTAQEIGVQGRNDSTGAEARATLAGRVDALLAKSTDRLNAKIDGEYLFAGSRSTTQPFNDDGTPASGTLSDFAGDRTRRIGPNVDVALNVSGEAVQTVPSGGLATDALQTLAAALRADDGAAIEAALAGIEEARDHFLGLESSHSEVAARLTEAEVQLTDADLRARSRQSELEDANLYEVATGLQRTQSHLEATLKTIASTSQRSLLDYL